MNNPVYFVAVYFFAVLVLGFYSWFKIKKPSDYYIAGKNAGPVAVTGSLLATILGASAILGTIELSQTIGWAALWFLFCASFGLFILAPLARKISRYGKYTLPGLLGHFYGERARKIASMVIPFAWLGIIAAQIIAGGKILAGLGMADYTPAAIIAGIIFIVYTLFGGQLSILKTDSLQSVLIIVGLLVLLIFTAQTPEADLMPPLTADVLFNESFSGIDLLILVLTYSVTFVVGPDIYSRIFCAKNEKTATISVLIVASVLIPISFGLTYLGIYSAQTGTAEVMSFAQNILPNWFYGLFIAALLSAVMSSADTTLLTSSVILCELFNIDMESKKAMRLTRLFVVLLGGVGIVIAILITSILQALLLALTFFSGAFVVPMIAGLLHLKVVKKQLVPAIVVGGVVALAGKIITITDGQLTGNLIIISAFLINGFLLFVPLRLTRHQ